MESVKPPPKPNIFAEPDFVEIHQQLKQKGVTRQLLWEEYKTAHPTNHYRYSQFCFYYREWQKYLKVSLRQSYKAGEKMLGFFAQPPETAQQHCLTNSFLWYLSLFPILSVISFDFSQSRKRAFLGQFSHSLIFPFHPPYFLYQNLSDNLCPKNFALS